MSRRYADYLPTDGFQPLNVVSTIGALHYPHMVERLRAEAHLGRHATVGESRKGFGPRTEPDRATHEQ